MVKKINKKMEIKRRVKPIRTKSSVKRVSKIKKTKKMVNKFESRHVRKRFIGKKSKYFVKRSIKKPKKDIAKTTMNSDYKKSVIPIIDRIISDQNSLEYLTKNVSKYTVDVIELLKIPKSDEEIAGILDMKINAVRRMLNIMQGYGITDYNTSKNKDGWLSFTWYINIKRIPKYFDYLDTMNTSTNILTENCNDYFICDNCYRENKLILTFDAAYESDFKCMCDTDLSRIGKDQVNELILKAKG